MQMLCETKAFDTSSLGCDQPTQCSRRLEWGNASLAKGKWFAGSGNSCVSALDLESGSIMELGRSSKLLWDHRQACSVGRLDLFAFSMQFRPITTPEHCTLPALKRSQSSLWPFNPELLLYMLHREQVLGWGEHRSSETLGWKVGDRATYRIQCSALGHTMAAPV